MKVVNEEFPRIQNCNIHLKDEQYVKLNRLVMLYFLGVEIKDSYHRIIRLISEYLDFQEIVEVFDSGAHQCYIDKTGDIIFCIKRDFDKRLELTMSIDFFTFCNTHRVDELEVVNIGIMLLLRKGIEFEIFKCDHSGIFSHIFHLEYLHRNKQG